MHGSPIISVWPKIPNLEENQSKGLVAETKLADVALLEGRWV